MRNDARPMGEHSPASPIGGDEPPIASERPDSRESVKHDRQSHIVNQEAEKREADDADDPVMPQNDATLKTRI